MIAEIFAWISIGFIWLCGAFWIYLHIVGGRVSYETKGIIPTIREHRARLKQLEEETILWLEQEKARFEKNHSNYLN